MTFGIFQDAYDHQMTLGGPKRETGIIGTTLNGVIYCSMPILSTLLDSGRWARYRRPVAIAGVLISGIAMLVSSWSTQVWHLIALQGVCAAVGSAMLFSPTTLFVDEWFRSGNRATAYSITLSGKNVVGTACPFLMYGLIDKLGFRNAIRVWAGIVFVTGILGLLIIPRASTKVTRTRPRHIPWSFLKHRTFYIYAIGNAVFSSGYGLPQTYLSQYASNELHLSGIVSSLMIALFNAPGIVSCFLMGFLCDRSSMSASAETQISTIGSALCVFLLWGLKSHEIPALLIVFSIGYGFFAGPYSSVWGGWIKEIEYEAHDHNEAINTGMVYGLLNGARGIGYVVGGLSGVELLKAGAVGGDREWAYGTKYGAVIIFTGICSVLGGWSICWQGGGSKIARRLWSGVSAPDGR
jgi:sugar phosphate permease